MQVWVVGNTGQRRPERRLDWWNMQGACITGLPVHLGFLQWHAFFLSILSANKGRTWVQLVGFDGRQSGERCRLYCLQVNVGKA